MSATYKSWAHMVQRCHNKNDHRYKYYGERGIKVHEPWLDFVNFLADMGEKPKGMSLDRIDNNGNYEPGNCRWVTQKVQNRNTRQNVWIEFMGQRKILTDWAHSLGLKPGTLRARIERGWSLTDALTKPTGDIW